MSLSVSHFPTIIPVNYVQTSGLKGHHGVGQHIEALLYPLKRAMPDFQLDLIKAFFCVFAPLEKRNYR